ncbi:hypothetical protein SUDANB96_06554 [Streptomyces sp. enrichment culture]
MRRRTPSRRLLATALLAVSMLTPMAVAPATSVHAAGVDRAERAGLAEGVGHSHEKGCPPHGLPPS